MRSVWNDFKTGYWEWGLGWWPGSARWLSFGREYYDGWWYGLRLGPFWASCAPFDHHERRVG